MSSCSLPAYLSSEYAKLPDGLTKNEFKRLVAERANELAAANGYVKMYKLVPIPGYKRRMKLPFENQLFENSYVKPQDSVMISENLNRLMSIKGRNYVWPSIYPKVYQLKHNTHFWTIWMSHEKQQVIRDSIDRYTLPILAASKYKPDTHSFYFYRSIMKLKRQGFIK